MAWKTIAAISLALLGAAILFLYSGIFDVAASKEHSTLFRWVASTAMVRSVKFHAEEISPPDLTSKAMLMHGAEHYRTMCLTCHGEPGREPSQIGKGLNPPAPELSKASEEWSDSQLHWIIRNGIRMTGMPAFGKTHDDKEIWSLVAFLKAISGRSPEQYRSLLNSLEGDGRDRVNQQGKHQETGEVEQGVPWKKESLF